MDQYLDVQRQSFEGNKLCRSILTNDNNKKYNVIPCKNAVNVVALVCLLLMTALSSGYIPASSTTVLVHDTFRKDMQIDYKDDNNNYINERVHETRLLRKGPYHANQDAVRAFSSHHRHYHIVYASLSDIWLCLACALGWCVWLVSVTRNPSLTEPIVFDAQDSRTVHGNVLQITLGEAADGTGIPVYHTLVDYVVESDTVDEEPLQVRKCFATRKLLEEGFANVEVLVLSEDPTQSILMGDYLEEKQSREHQEPLSMPYLILVYVVGGLLIVTSWVGGWNAIWKMKPERQIYGKWSLGIGTVLLYPTALLIYHILILGYKRLVAPLADRPGVIIYGAHSLWKKRCGATLNPLEVLGAHDSPSKRGRTNSANSSIELPHFDTNRVVNNKYNNFYPNAGCGIGNFNVHMPLAENHESSVSSMSGSQATSQSGDASSETNNGPPKLPLLPNIPFLPSPFPALEPRQQRERKTIKDQLPIHHYTMQSLIDSPPTNNTDNNTQDEEQEQNTDLGTDSAVKGS